MYTHRIRTPYLYFNQTSSGDGQIPHARGRFGAHFLNRDAISMQLGCLGLIHLRFHKEKVLRLSCPFIAVFFFVCEKKEYIHECIDIVCVIGFPHAD